MDVIKHHRRGGPLCTVTAKDESVQKEAGRIIRIACHRERMESRRSGSRGCHAISNGTHVIDITLALGVSKLIGLFVNESRIDEVGRQAAIDAYAVARHEVGLLVAVERAFDEDVGFSRFAVGIAVEVGIDGCHVQGGLQLSLSECILPR